MEPAAYRGGGHLFTVIFVENTLTHCFAKYYTYLSLDNESVL